MADELLDKIDERDLDAADVILKMKQVAIAQCKAEIEKYGKQIKQLHSLKARLEKL